MKNKAEKSESNWYLLDAKNQVLGRFASLAANRLRGKDEIHFANNSVIANKVVVINCERVRVTGKKEEAKKYYRHSGFHGGLKTASLSDLRVKDATLILRHAITGMLPRNKLSILFLKNLYLYNGEDQPHTNVKFVKVEK